MPEARPLLKKGDLVRLRIHMSKALPKGSLGVVTDLTPARDACQRGWMYGVYVEWRRGTRDWVRAAHIKPAKPETLTKQQRLWLVKRRFNEASRGEWHG